MYTKSPVRFGIAVVIAAAWIGVSSAEKIQPAASTSDDAAIDRALGALRSPVLHLVLGGEKGAPIWPLYKQEIAKGQTDFRPAPTRVETPARRERRSSPAPKPPLPQPPPQPQPCTPNTPNWPNCLQP